MSRTKTQYRSFSRESYEKFINENPKCNISSKEYKKIIYEINWAYRDYILESGERVRMPYGFGDIGILKKKRRVTKKNPITGEDVICLPIDWVKTKKAGKYIYNFNHHTDGYFYGWIYFKRTGRMKFSKLWSFKPSRDSARLLAKYLKDPSSDYKYLYRECPTIS